MDDIRRFQADIRKKRRTIYHQVIKEDMDVREYATEDCPMLLTL